LLCEITGTIAVVLLGLMASRQVAGRLAGRQAGRQIMLNSEILKIIYQTKYSSFLGI